MSITVNNSNIEEYIQEQLARSKEALIYRMCVIGEQVLNKARSVNSYKDRTGNLRSSIGYVVVCDGEVVRRSDFAQVKQGLEGVTAGNSYLEELVSKYPQGIVLIVVAGMNYAVYVKKKGFDVLDSSELLAEQLLEALKLEFEK